MVLEEISSRLFTAVCCWCWAAGSRLMKQSALRSFSGPKGFDVEGRDVLTVPADPLTAAEQAGKQAIANDNAILEQAAA